MTIRATTRIRRFAVASAGWAILGTAGCGDPSKAPPATQLAPAVTVTRPVLRPVVETRRYTGRLEPAERVEVRARVRGYLDKVLFTEGVEVEKGTPLYEIDPRTFQAVVDMAKAEVSRAEAEFRLAEKEFDRVSQLRAAGSVSADEYDHRVSAKATAAAVLAQGRAKLEAATLDLGFTKVTAPIAGRTGRTLVTAGNLVGQGEPTLLTTVTRTDTLHLIFEVPEADLLAHGNVFTPSRTAGGGPIIRFGLDTDAGSPHTAVVDFRDTAVDPGTGTVMVRAVIANPDRKFSPGLFARVEVPLPRPAPLPHVPEAALGTDQQGRFVYVVDATGTARRRAVATGPAGGGLVAVEDGLTPNDRVIVAGLVRVRPGAPVTARESPAAGGGSK